MDTFPLSHWQALPCSSGSSELWFACKVFTGEEVVIKRVSSGQEAAFERERAALKVGNEEDEGCYPDRPDQAYDDLTIKWRNELLTIPDFFHV